MARPGPQTFAKRQRELAKLEKRKAKAEKKALRKAQKKLEAEGGAIPQTFEPQEADEAPEAGEEEV